MEHLGLSEQGVELSARGIKLQPNLADAWFQYGRALLLSGEHTGAIATLSRNRTLSRNSMCRSSKNSLCID